MKELSQTADAILQNAVTISVDTPARGWFQKLLVKYKLRNEKRVFHVKPLVLGSLVRISKLLLTIDASVLTRELLEDKFRLFNENYQLMEKHARPLAEIVAVAVTNTRQEPGKHLVDLFYYHLSAKDLLAVVQVVLQQMDIGSFTASIISARGLNVLEEKDASATSAGTNPMDKGS